MNEVNSVAHYDLETQEIKQHFDCIYCYVNKINGKKYVGQARKLKRRHNEHVSYSYQKDKGDYDLPFHRAIRKYTIKNFNLIILIENIESQEERNELETYYIELYNTLTKNSKGYNVSSGGGQGNNFEGKTEEELLKIKVKMSISGKGKRVGKLNGMYGKTHTEEVKQRLREVNLGKKHTQETKRKMSLSNKGRKHSDLTKEKISEGNKGKVRTQETKQKISTSRIEKGVSRGSKNPKAKPIVALNIVTGEVLEFDYIGGAEIVLEEKHKGIRFSSQTIRACCKYNNNPSLYLKTHKNPKRPIGKEDALYTFFYKEDYKKLTMEECEKVD